MVKKQESQEPIAKDEIQLLSDEKVELATVIGIWGTFNPIEDYQSSKEYKRIKEINKRLSEIIIG